MSKLRNPLVGVPAAVAVALPPGATVADGRGPGRFITGVRYRLADGRPGEVGTRAYRKALSNATGRGLNWWIGLLFAIGSTCFALGPLPSYTRHVGEPKDFLTYFVGSIFFTSAAFLSYVEVVRAHGRRWFGYFPDSLGFWATAVQLVGTVFFNVMTLAACFPLPSVTVARALVWVPDAVGSVCFLVASWFAFAEAGHKWFSWRPGARDWHVTLLNWWGSVFFGISAIGGFILADGSYLSLPVANLGTFLGAICFFVAAVIMMPEGRGEQVPAPAPR